MNEPSGIPMGAVIAYAGNAQNVPDGWLICDGSPIDPVHAELITLIGSTTTPNLCGRTLIGAGLADSEEQQADGTVPHFDKKSFPSGYTGGEFKHVLIESEMPKHSHTTSYGYVGDNTQILPGADWGLVTTAQGATTGAAGGDLPHNNMPPYFAINFIIKAVD